MQVNTAVDTMLAKANKAPAANFKLRLKPGIQAYRVRTKT